ncbi:glycosyltransferase family 2 protein [Chryseobacterium rhizosphaerae]|uniref:glycosyltransferase family 2 protein n=1 Tax=Chryseobacterium rhizosphaerae TaxID=395937 RepID=UPI00235846CA|nr:glycosyltransferase family 2 protein [Chryseobacterium rhizosphaerae]MDC8098923.1 glycosyltransferase family 2 protein [Chryseobacterium rhizosphaerae]
MISVCLTTYNGAKFLTQQLDSILSQLGANDEVIISDDGSTDETLLIIKNYSDTRIKLLHHKPQSGKYRFSLTTNNFQNALQNAKGNYIFFADQDDIWKENKVEECVKLLQQGYDLVLHDTDIIDENNHIISKSYFEINNSKLGIVRNILNNSYLGCCMALNKKFLNKILPFPSVPVPHDIWVGILYEYFGNVILTEQKLLSYRRHGENVSPSGEKSKNSIIFKLKYRANFIIAFLKRII